MKLLIALIFISLSAAAQNKCECCAYYSIDTDQFYEDFFNRDIITKFKMSTAIVYTKSPAKDKYIQAKFFFDEKGNIQSHLKYNGGTPHMRTDYTRNNDGKIIKTIEYYLKEDESRSDFMDDEITTYSYDAKGNLVGIKGESSTINYTYDARNRQISEIHTLDLADSKSVKTSRTIYNGNTSTSTILNDGEKWLTITSNFKDGNKNRVIRTNTKSRQLVLEENFTYYSNGNIKSYATIAGNIATECPDGSSITENYFYNNNLIEKIIHKYKGVTCEMSVFYNSDL